MRVLRFFLILILFSGSSLYAQDFLRVDQHEFAGDSLEGKRLLKNIKKAKKLFYKGKTASSECLNLLQECLSFNNANAELNYNIGLCYLKYGKKELALSYMEQVKEIKPNLNTEMYLLLGQAFHYSNDFTNAILNYKIYLELLQKNDGRKKADFVAVSRYIEECKNGQVFIEIPTEFDVEKMPSPINSDYNDVLAIKDGIKLFFNSDRKLKSDTKKTFEEGSLRGFSVQLKNGEWTGFSVLNDEKHTRNLPLMVSKIDNNQYLFYDKNKGAGDLIFMQKNDNFWLKEMDVFFVNKVKTNESSASFSADGNTVVFVSNRDGGKGDIFYCNRVDDGKWSEPVKLGEQINSAYDERDVFLSSNGKVMYFSSNGRNTMGGYDIFKSEKDENGNWIEAKNMGFPINSPYDECHFSPYEGDSFLFDSNRGEGGNFDIYTKKLIVDIVNVPEVNKEPVVPMPVPVDEEVSVPLVIYKIQIAASRYEIANAELKHLYRGAEEVTQLYDGDWYRYTIGNYTSKEEAIFFKDKSGVKEAFVTRFENGKRTGFITNFSLGKN